MSDKKALNKVINLESVSPSEKESVILCYGHFNIIHPGHIRYLEYARKHGSKLVVSIQGDKAFRDSGRKHHFSEQDRASGVAFLHIVDQVIPLGDSSLKDVIYALKPDQLILGKEFERSRSLEMEEAKSLLLKQGGLVLYHAGEIQYASSDLLKESLLDIRQERCRLFRAACERQTLKTASLLQSINKFKEASLLVIGDTILDQYIACDAVGMSAEAPVIVVRELESRDYIGGAAIVAAHVQALGAKCHFVSVVGQDNNAKKVKQELKRLRVDHRIIEEPSRPTTLKIRYMVDNQKIFRVSRLKEHSLPPTVEKQVINEIKRIAPQVRGILVSDFVYGMITSRVLETIYAVADRHHLLLFGDLQCSSQIGNIGKFKDFNLLCPTEREARIALDAKEEGLEWIANTLIDKTKSDNIVMKLGADGFIAYETKANRFVNRQHFAALTVNPVDLSGAGDSLLAALAVGICSGASLMQASALGACMAALTTQTVGNIPVSQQQLQSYVSNMKIEI